MLRCCCRWLLMILLTPALALEAGSVVLNSATVPILDNSDAEFDKAVTAALQRVIVRLTGDSRSLEQAGVKSVLEQSKRYNTAFGYLQGAEGLTLRADFDLGALSGALRGRGFKVWGKDRPQIATWLAIAEPDGGYSVSPRATTKTVFDALTRQAAERVIVVRRLVPDAAAAILVTQAASDDALQSDLITAATATGAAAGFVILLKQSPELTWQAQCRLSVEGEISNWTAADSTAETLAAGAIARAGDEVSRHFARLEVAGGNATVQLTVVGVKSVDDYGRALSYLSGLDVVAQVNVKQISGSEVVFDLLTRGGLPALAQGIGFGSVLVPVPDQTATYTWK